MRRSRYSNLWLAATALLQDGSIKAYDAVYRFTTPDGFVKRNTRLAATIFVLRHEYGWDIETIEEPERLAEYLLIRPGILPRGVTP